MNNDNIEFSRIQELKTLPMIALATLMLFLTATGARLRGRR